MVELIVVMVLAGILAAIGASRFFNRSGFDASAYGEQVRGMARYAQKLAIAQNRNVFVEGSLDGVSLCYIHALPCPVESQVPAPAGSNSGNDATKSFCSVGGVYAQGWYCEGRPAGVTMTAVSGGASLSPFYFNGLGKPYLPDDAKAMKNGVNTDSSFQGMTLALSADGSRFEMSVSQETGYVY